MIKSKTFTGTISIFDNVLLKNNFFPIRNVENINVDYDEWFISSTSYDILHVKFYSVNSNFVSWDIRYYDETKNTNKYGYHYVYMKRKFYLHKVMASTFLNNYSKSEKVKHLDNNKNNNSPDNLEWVTTSPISRYFKIDKESKFTYENLGIDKPFKITYKIPREETYEDFEKLVI